MPSWKNVKAVMNEDAPTFHVRYLGKVETGVSHGKGCTVKPVGQVWFQTDDRKLYAMKKSTIKIGLKGIFIRDPNQKNSTPSNFDIERISYCCADSVTDGRLFSWVYQEGSGKGSKFWCHVVLCSSEEKARLLAVCLTRAFQIAYKDYKKIQQRMSTASGSSNVTSLSVTTDVTLINGSTGVSPATSSTAGSDRSMNESPPVRSCDRSTTDSPPFHPFVEAVDEPRPSRKVSFSDQPLVTSIEAIDLHQRLGTLHARRSQQLYMEEVYTVRPSVYGPQVPSVYDSHVPSVYGSQATSFACPVPSVYEPTPFDTDL